MANKENLTTGSEKVSEDQLKKRFDDIVEEIKQVGGVDSSDDEIKSEKIEGLLNGQFAEFLLRTENRTALEELKKDVDKMRNNWDLSGKAGSQLETLYKFLDDITNESRMEKDYNEFMERIQNPKKLNKIHSWEIRRLNLYLGIHEDKALDAYKAMKPIYGKFDENGMKSEDKTFFESVWKCLEVNYADNDKFLEEDYPAVKGLEPKVSSLKPLAGDNWDGSNDTITVPKVEGSIVSSDRVKERVVRINTQRINSNRDTVEKISITVDDLSKFTKKDGVLKYDGVEFDAEKMMELFKDKIMASADEGTDFVNIDGEDKEKARMVEECKDKIYDNLKNYLMDKVSDEQPSQGGNDPEIGGEEPTNLTYEEGKENFKIKMPALKDKIIQLGFFDGNEEGEKVKFDITKVKDYLEGLKDKSWNELERPSDPVDRGVWTIAVQIALNYLAQGDHSDYNVHYIDGIRGRETVKGVKAFQEANGLRFRNNQPDGLPGKVTITKILEVLGSSVGGQVAEQPAVEQPAVEQPAVEQPAAEQPVTQVIEQPTEDLTISGSLDSFNVSNPVLDFSALSSLTKNGADKIVGGINDKLSGQTLSSPLLIKLDGLTSLDEDVAQKLSVIDGGISLDGLLNEIDFDGDCDDIVNVLNTLAPENGKVNIVAPNSDIKSKLEAKGVKKIVDKDQPPQRN